MRLTRQTKFGLWAVAAIVLGAGAFFFGSALRPGAEPHYIYQTEAPAYDAPAVLAATSPGGFTGFGETDGTNSRVVISGRVTDISDSQVTLEGPAGQTTLRFADSPRIQRLDEGDVSALEPGARVALRLNGAGDRVESVLVLSQP
jgi:hypothetical protein